MAVALKEIMLYMFPSWVLLLISLKACSPSMPQVAVFSILAILASTWLFYGLWRTLYCKSIAGDKLQSINVYNMMFFLLIIASLVMAFSYLTGSRHDYVAYIQQWEVILRGADPWLGTDNAYGPIHNLLAWIYMVNRLLPKLFGSLLLVATGAISAFCQLGIEDKSNSSQRLSLFASFVLSPFALITVSLYANNDIFPAAAMVLSIVGIVSFKSIPSRIISGGLLAIGTMIKFYPLIIIPSLSVRHRSIDWAFISGFVGTLITIVMLAYDRWGKSVLIPLTFAGSRGSKHLSMFNFTSNVMGLNLDRFSIPLMLVVFATTTYFLFKLNVGPLLTSILTFAAVLSFYKVGHQQFFLFFFLVGPFAIRYFLSCSNILTSKVSALFFLWIGFLNWYQLEYSLTCGMWQGLAKLFRHWGALLYLMISAMLALTILKKITAKNFMLADSSMSST